jgi:hypothetical protein
VYLLVCYVNVLIHHVMKTYKGPKTTVPAHSRPLYVILRMRSSSVLPMFWFHFYFFPHGVYFTQKSASLSYSYRVCGTCSSFQQTLVFVCPV